MNLNLNLFNLFLQRYRDNDMEADQEDGSESTQQVLLRVLNYNCDHTHTQVILVLSNIRLLLPAFTSHHSSYE